MVTGIGEKKALFQSCAIGGYLEKKHEKSQKVAVQARQEDRIRNLTEGRVKSSLSHQSARRKVHIRLLGRWCSGKKLKGRVTY